MTFLQDRTPRERALVYGGAALLVLFIIWQFIISPAFAAKEQAERAQSSALRDYVIVRDGIGLIGAPLADVTGGQPFDRASLVAAAQTGGLTLSRLQPDNNGELKVWLDNAQGTALFEFLKSVTQHYDTQITRAQVNRNADGSVSAQVTFTTSP